MSWSRSNARLFCSTLTSILPERARCASRRARARASASWAFCLAMVLEKENRHGKTARPRMNIERQENKPGDSRRGTSSLSLYSRGIGIVGNGLKSGGGGDRGRKRMIL